MAARWIELSVQAEGPVQDTISNFLVEHGSTGIVCGDRSLRAFFPDTTDDARSSSPWSGSICAGSGRSSPTVSWAGRAGG